MGHSLGSLKDQTIAVRDNENNEDFINEFNFSDNLKNFLQIEMVTAAKELIRMIIIKRLSMLF